MTDTIAVTGIPVATDDNLKNLVLPIGDFVETDTTRDPRTRRSSTQYDLESADLAQSVSLSTFTAPGAKRTDFGWTTSYAATITDSDGNVVVVPDAVVVKTTVVISGLPQARMTDAMVADPVRAHQRVIWGDVTSGNPSLTAILRFLRGNSRILGS